MVDSGDELQLAGPSPACCDETTPASGTPTVALARGDVADERQFSAAVTEEPLVIEMSLWSWGISTALMVSWGVAKLMASPIIVAYRLLNPADKSSGS